MNSFFFIRTRISLFFLINSFIVFFYLLHLGVIPIELTNGTLLSGMVWYIVLLIPVIVPLVVNTLAMKWTVFIIGFITTLINIFIGAGYLLDKQFSFGIIVIFFWGTIGGLATFFSYKWIRVKD